MPNSLCHLKSPAFDLWHCNTFLVEILPTQVSYVKRLVNLEWQNLWCSACASVHMRQIRMNLKKTTISYNERMSLLLSDPVCPTSPRADFLENKNKLNHFYYSRI